jgi:hypothetical protein
MYIFPTTPEDEGGKYIGECVKLGIGLDGCADDSLIHDQKGGAPWASIGSINPNDFSIYDLAIFC